MITGWTGLREDNTDSGQDKDKTGCAGKQGISV